MFAEFESAARCTSFQHPQPPQPLYMMSTGPGTYIVPSDFVYGIDDTSLYTFLPWFFAWVTKGWYGSPSKRTPEHFSHGLDTHLVAQPTAKALMPQLSGETCLLNIIFMDLQLAFREGDDSPFYDGFLMPHTHTRLTALCPGLPRWAGTRKVKPIWILLKQETVSGSGIIWAICKSALRFRQIATPAPHPSVFYRPDVLPAAQPTASKHWCQYLDN